MSLAEKEADLRWHVASTNHREFTCVPNYIRRGDYTPVPSAVPDPDCVDLIWVITCCGIRHDILDAVTCGYERRVTEFDLHEAGRVELKTHPEIIAWLDSIAHEPERVRPSSWDKILEDD